MIIGIMIRAIKTIMCLNSQLFDDFEVPLYMSLYVHYAMCQLSVDSAVLKCGYN